mmetsp:Transcript_44895/g.142957  ORF Transcript_44895/g.142957 Transcript_44895/m.142957 type:complete len:259 (+) Transcript_44895:156-932(+)
MHVVLEGGQLPVHVLEGALERPEGVSVLPHPQQQRRDAAVPSREQPLHHAPLVALRAEVHVKLPHGLLEAGQLLAPAPVHTVPLERGVGLGDEGAAAEGEAQPRRRLAHVLHHLYRLFYVVVLLPGHPHHPVQLQLLQPALLGVGCSNHDLLLLELLVDDLPHPRGAALHCHREGLGAAPRQHAGKLQGHRVGPHRGDTHSHVRHLRAAEVLNKAGKLGVLRHGGAQEAEPVGELEPPLDRRNERIIQVGGAEGQGKV